MLDQILQSVQRFEVEHGMSPDTVYINPYHYDGLRGCHPDLFGSDEPVVAGFPYYYSSRQRPDTPRGCPVRHDALVTAEQINI